MKGLTMKIFTTIALSAALLTVAPLSSIAATHSAAPATSAEATSKVAGEVRKVDRSARKITIKHEELKHLDMPAMTMVFKAKDPAMLDKVKKGDKVEFVAEKVNGQFTVTEIEPKE
jgi:Cu(I)/Ag(I) efflux system protein CusF